MAALSPSTTPSDPMSADRTCPGKWRKPKPTKAPKSAVSDGDPQVADFLEWRSGTALALRSVRTTERRPS
jgi:hypothetical protein